MILVDVAREDGSVLLSDLKELGIGEKGSIAIEDVDSHISKHADRAVEAARGAPADAVVWEEVSGRTSEDAELSLSFVAFMVLATLIASVGIILDTPILIIGAMVVGPEFGPIAGFCVAVIQRQRGLAGRSLLALAVGFPVGIGAALAASLLFKWTGIGPATFDQGDHELAKVIASPDFYALFVASVRRDGGNAVAQHRQVRRADRRPDLRHHDPRRRQHRCGRRLCRLGRPFRGLAGPAGDQPGSDSGGRSDHAGDPASDLPPPPRQAPARPRTSRGRPARQAG